MISLITTLNPLLFFSYQSTSSNGQFPPPINTRFSMLTVPVESCKFQVFSCITLNVLNTKMFFIVLYLILLAVFLPLCSLSVHLFCNILLLYRNLPEHPAHVHTYLPNENTTLLFLPLQIIF